MIYSTNRPANEDKFTMGLNGVYATGNLETFLGNDIIVTDSLEVYVKYSHLLNSEQRNTLSVSGSNIETFAMNDIGETKKVKLILWKAEGIARGYAFLIDDIEAYRFAREKFVNRDFNL
jgi:hypothetical protein